MASDELTGIVIDIEKEELQQTKKKKPLAARVALSPLTFIAAQGRALLHGPINPKLPEIEFVQRWIIRFEVPKKNRARPSGLCRCQEVSSKEMFELATRFVLRENLQGEKLFIATVLLMLALGRKL